MASIIQFSQPLTQEDRQQLTASGVSIEQYLGGTTYLVTTEVAEDLGRIGRIRMSSTLGELAAAGELFQPRDKVRASTDIAA